jgi:hypothetical protein
MAAIYSQPFSIPTSSIPEFSKENAAISMKQFRTVQHLPNSASYILINADSRFYFFSMDSETEQKYLNCGSFNSYHSKRQPLTTFSGETLFQHCTST